MKEILRSLRIKNNYSQIAVAEYLEISRQMYNKYENGTAEPSLKNIKKLCELYKVSADVLLENIQKNDNKISYSYSSESSNMSVASPSVSYGSITTRNFWRVVNPLYSKILDRFGYWCYTLNNRNG